MVPEEFHRRSDEHLGHRFKTVSEYWSSFQRYEGRLMAADPAPEHQHRRISKTKEEKACSMMLGSPLDEVWVSQCVCLAEQC